MTNRGPTKDPFLSPILFSDNSLLKLPIIRMTVGDRDCLRDETIRLHKRLHDLK